MNPRLFFASAKKSSLISVYLRLVTAQEADDARLFIELVVRQNWAVLRSTRRVVVLPGAIHLLALLLRISDNSVPRAVDETEAVSVGAA